MAVKILLSFVVGGFVNVAALAYGSRRLLGTRGFPLPRTLAAALAGQALANVIIRALASGVDPRRQVPAVIAVLALGMSCALVFSMAVLVVCETFLPTGTVPPPRRWRRSIRDRVRRARRYWQIVGIFASCGLGPLLRGRGGRVGAVTRSTSLAASLCTALDRSGVVFIKFGQALSTRADLVPSGFADELGRLQDRATPVPWDQIERVLVSELGAAPEELFAQFEREPLASASIAQVHAAQLRSGERVVVKVCRPGIEALVERDLDIIKRLATRLLHRATWAAGLDVVTLADGFAAALREELDLRVEARNLLAVVAADPGAVAVPHAYKDLSTRKVLVMQRLDGVALSKAGPEIDRLGLDRGALAAALLDSLLKQIIIDGVFHADPHPGNILLLDDGRVGLIDFGSVGRLDTRLRAALRGVLFALDRRDPAALADALTELTIRPEDLDQNGLERALGALLMRHLSDGQAPAEAAMFADLFRIATRHGLAVPPPLAAALRALSTLDGSLRALAPGFDIVAHAENFGRTRLREGTSPRTLMDAAGDGLVTLLPMLRSLPRRAGRIAAAVEDGRMTINVRFLADARDRATVTGWLHQTLLTVLSASAGIMAVLLLGHTGGPVLTASLGLYQFLGYCLLVTCALLALCVLSGIFGARQR